MISRRNALLCMTGSILLSSVAQLFMKVSMLLIAQQTAQGGVLPDALLQPAVIGWLFVGLSSYAVSLVFWLFAISRLELSLAYPMLSLSYVIVYIVAASWPFLHESISWTRSLGILVVILGVILIARSENRGDEVEVKER